MQVNFISDFTQKYVNEVYCKCERMEYLKSFQNVQFNWTIQIMEMSKKSGIDISVIICIIKMLFVVYNNLTLIFIL